ncbi:MAG: hypothetical protein LBL98_08510 [Ruminococcus sp.]|jgi:hypothetical protein|nr:hypothetical protein [Ruminococcus sp.]
MRNINLLQIKRIPIDIEINVTPWKYERIEGEITPKRDTVNIAKPLPIINDFGLHDRLDITGAEPTAYTYQPLHAVNGLNEFSANAENGEIGDDLVSQIKKNPIRAKMAARPIESVTSKVMPRQKPSGNVINWSNGSQNYSFDSDGNGDYSPIIAPSEWKFVPRSVEITINQLPGLEIEYIGTPLYFPRSADPNYIPPEEI